MTEDDYILVGDLRTITMAQHLLRHIVPANNPVIAADDYQHVLKVLDAWREDLHAAIRKRLK